MKTKRFIDKYFWHGIITIVVLGGVANAFIWFWPRQAQLELPSYPVEKVIKGQDLYQANCSACHGVEGKGYAQESIPAPPLNGTAHSWHHTDSLIKSWIQNGIGQMPAVGPNWTDDELDSVLAYVKQWWGPEELARQTMNSRLNP